MENSIQKNFKCSDVGMDCEWSISAPTEEIVLAEVKEHAKNIHGFEDFTLEVLEKIKANIKDV